MPLSEMPVGTVSSPSGVAKEIPVHTLNCNNYLLFIRRKCTIKHDTPVEGIFPLTSAVDYEYQHRQLP